MDGFFFCTLKKSDKIDKWLKADNAPIAMRKTREEQTGKRQPLTIII
jgi:hypothetical protein